jgi:hypothetical protein
VIARARARPIAVVFALAGLFSIAYDGAHAAPAGARPFYYDRAITDADLAGRSLRELEIMRNTIFARAGQPFRKKWLHEYFSALPWYKSKGIVDPQSLPAIDQKNADLLSRHQIALPRDDLDRRLKALLDRHRNARNPHAIPAVGFSPRGKAALLSDYLGVRIVDLATGAVTTTLDDGRGAAVGFVAGRLATLTLSGGRIVTSEIGGPKGKTLSTLPLFEAPGTAKPGADGRTINWNRDAVFTPDGRRVLMGPSVYEDDGQSETKPIDQQDLVAVDIPSATVVFRQPVDDDSPCFAVSPDGKQAVVSSSGAVALWDLTASKTLWRRPRDGKDASAARCTAVAFSPDGRLAVKAARAGALLLEVKSGQLLRTLALPFGGVLAFSPDGGQLLVGGEANGDKPSLELWDVKRGQRIHALPAAGDIKAMAWSPDGRRALTDGERGPMLWDIFAARPVPGLFAGFETWWNRDEQIEAVLLSRALGRPLDQFAQLEFERTPFDAPALLDELVPAAQLEGMSRRDLRLLRNMVYARRGRPFRSEILRDYFGKLDWYKADPAYTDARLKPVDRRNIKLIQSAEIAAGGPMTEHEHREPEVPEA